MAVAKAQEAFLNGWCKIATLDGTIDGRQSIAGPGRVGIPTRTRCR
jgi:hypothetical protein